jgi:hypothetical protein
VLLRHLSPHDPAVADFISLPRINRNFWVVMDSDLQAEGEELGVTKVRVREALTNHPGLAGAWVTAGYTVENYVPVETLREAVAEVHPDCELTWSGDRYVNPLGSEQLSGRASRADKAAVAQAVIRRWVQAPDWPLDLGARVDELAEMIRQANDLPSAGPKTDSRGTAA